MTKRNNHIFYHFHCPHHTTLKDKRKESKYTSSFRKKRNFNINLHFLEKYNEEYGKGLDICVITDMAHLFSAWEDKYVFSLENGYENFRDNVIGMDYDEMLEMYIEYVVQPSVKPYWQSDSNYSYFKTKIIPQINRLRKS